MASSRQIIDQTKKWINDVVVGCNFCPFAAKVIMEQTVHYKVENSDSLNICMNSFLQETSRLDHEVNIETIFLIFPNSFKKFEEYLDMVSLADQLLKQCGYEGIYQLASFHPLYRFANSPARDVASYTNRSIYPMLQLLREESIDKALQHYKNPEKIPERNIEFARKKGLAYMKNLRDECLKA